MKYSHYLATTGISEIWDSESNLLLLGPWCLTGKKSKTLIASGGKNYTMVPSPWKPGMKVREAEDYCHAVYESLLPQLTEQFNAVHCVSHSLRYWRVLAGPWLLHFIEIFYDRYRRIENALEKFPDFYTHVLPREKCALESLNIFDFLGNGGKVNEDYYNLMLYSLAAHDVCPDKTVQKDVDFQTKVQVKGVGWKRKLLLKVTEPFSFFLQSPVVLSDMYNMTFEDKLLVKRKAGFTNVCFRDFYNPYEMSAKKNVSTEIRKKLEFKGAHDRFQTLLFQVLPEAVPLSYLENYALYRSRVRQAQSAKIVGSSVGWVFNESFKFFCAEAVLRNSTLIDFQHGGNFGQSFSVSNEAFSYEKEVLFTWGWDSEKQGNTKALPFPYLSRMKDAHAPDKDNILFVGMGMLKYPYRFCSALFPDDMPKYFEDKKMFFEGVSAPVKKKLLYRPYVEIGWDEVEQVKGMCPGIQMASEGNLVDWMKQVRLVVIDHPHTSFLEAMTINVPCIFFWDHDVYLMRPEAEKYFEMLRAAGILYKNPEDAAKKVNEVYNDAESWWKRPDVQEAKNKFCRRFAYTSKDWAEEWAKELRALLKSVS